MDLITQKVMKNCLKQLLNKYCSIEEAHHKPSPKELAEYLIKNGIICDRKKSKIFGQAYYVIHLCGFDFTLSKSRGEDATCIDIGKVPPIYTMGNLYVYLSPPLFYTMMRHLIYRVVPLISPAIEEYIWDVKKKILVSEIHKAARRGRK